MLKKLRSIVLAVLVCTAAEGELERNWTSNDGMVIRGLMLGTQGEAVAIQVAATGKTAMVPLTRLSEADRAHVAARGWPLPEPWTKWPTDIKININDVEVETERDGDAFIYRTRNFEIHSAAELGQVVIKDIGRIFEATYRLLAASPWGILAQPEKGRFRAELYLDRESYIRAGAPPNSAGVYLSQRKVFMVPFESLGLKQSSQGWRRTSDYTTRTLIHELTHMLMDDALQTLPMWLVEGTAEYMELMPMRIGAFSPAGHFNALRDHNASAPAHSLAETFSMDHTTWQNDGLPPVARGPGQTVRIRGPFGPPPMIPQFYHAGLLLTYYFIHLDGDGDAARLQRFIAASTRNARKVEEYHKAAQTYDAAIAEFLKQPGVEILGGGNFRYPSSMTPPAAPEFPFDCTPEELPFLEIDLLLAGRSKQQLIAEASAALTKRSLSVTGGSGR